MKKAFLGTSIVILILIVSLIIIYVSKSQLNYQKIENVSESQILRYQTDSERIVTSILTIKGEVNGRFTINGLYKIEAGKVDRKIRSDWYDNQIEITYDPINVTEGHLKIKIELY